MHRKLSRIEPLIGAPRAGDDDRADLLGPEPLGMLFKSNSQHEAEMNETTQRFVPPNPGVYSPL